MATVLVVEDDPDMREIERTALSCGNCASASRIIAAEWAEVCRSDAEIENTRKNWQARLKQALELTPPVPA